MAGRKKVGLALGGGGARGIAHLGVLYALEKFAVPVDMIAGTSMGALIGTMYATHRDARKINRLFFEAQESPEYKTLGLDAVARKARQASRFKRIKSALANYSLQHHMGFLKAEPVAAFLRTLLGDAGFDDMKIPLALIAGNISKGEGKTFRDGDLQKAVRASMSLPLWMEPVDIDGDLYVDGIAHDVVPVKALREMGADIAIAVDVSLRETHPHIRNALEAKYIADAMAVNRSIDLSLEHADIVIRPDVGGLMWYDFRRSPRLLKAGREAAEAAMPKILRILG